MKNPLGLAEILSGARITLKSLRSGHTEQITCPKCEGGRTKERSFSVTIDEDGDGAAWLCHRGGCGHSGGARTRTGEPPRREVAYRRPAELTPEQAAHRPDWLYEFFAERKIGARAVMALGIHATDRNFPHPVGRSPAIVFPYTLGGVVLNHKYRPHPAKHPMMQDRDAEPTLFNVDALGDSPGEVVWVEGEMDVAALVECGVNHAVTLKDGAPATPKPETDPDAKRFAALKTHADILAGVKRFVLAGDMDAPGLALREELARRLGRHLCHLATWPEGCKDAGDTLREHGPDAVLKALADARPYPIEGVQRVGPGTLLALRRMPPPAVLTTGTPPTDDILALPAEGRLIIVTGWPGSGKTNWTRFVMVHTALTHGRRWAVFSPEMQPWEQFVAECAEVWSGKPFWPRAGHPSMTDTEITAAEDWLSTRVTMLVCDAEDQVPTLDWILEKATVTVRRDGTTDLVIDPWNEVDLTRGTMTETEFIGRCLQRLKAFALRHGVNVWLIAHPAKPPALKPGDIRGPAGPYDIAASAHFFNRADLGLTIHSPESGEAEVHVWKSRFRRWSQKGKMARLFFDPVVGRYGESERHGPASDEIMKRW